MKKKDVSLLLLNQISALLIRITDIANELKTLVNDVKSEVKISKDLFKKKKKKKKELEQIPGVKKPFPAFLIFVREMSKIEEYKHLAVIEKSQVLGNKWKSLSPRDQAVYYTMAAEEKKEYIRALEDYKQNRENHMYTKVGFHSFTLEWEDRVQYSADE